MQCRRTKFTRVRTIALVASMAVLASLVIAGPSLAAAPPVGTACQASDGKISGRGATFQTVAQQTFIAGYKEDVCGPVPSQGANDPAPNDMVTYNYPDAVAASATGSGNGRSAADCRTDAFAGTDSPYSNTQLTQLWSAPATLNASGCDLPFIPPYTPAGVSNPGPPQTWHYPLTGGNASVAAPLMSFPVAGAAVQLAANLTGRCTTTPAVLNMTTLQISAVLGGTITTWNDPALAGSGAPENGCSGSITRVVRQDTSGTSGILKRYLRNADTANPNPRLCNSTSTTADSWVDATYNTDNPNWPSGGTCSAKIDAGTSGAPALLGLLDTTAGGIGYADAADWAGHTEVPVALRNRSNTAFVAALKTPGDVTSGSNCTFRTAIPNSGSNPTDIVGLNEASPGVPSNSNWANNVTPNFSDQTWQSAAPGNAGYPICGVTFDLVYSGINSNGSNGMTWLSANQRRTLYSYVTYMMSPAAQQRLKTAGYAPIPQSFWDKIRAGFQSAF